MDADTGHRCCGQAEPEVCTFIQRFAVRGAAGTHQTNESSSGSGTPTTRWSNIDGTSTGFSAVPKGPSNLEVGASGIAGSWSAHVDQQQQCFRKRRR